MLRMSLRRSPRGQAKAMASASSQPNAQAFRNARGGPGRSHTNKRCHQDGEDSGEGLGVAVWERSSLL
jgi:hypothetical protein